MISSYSIALFLHVGGDICIFIGIGGQLLSLLALRQANDVAQVRPIAGLITLSERVSVLSALLTIVTGLYMGAAVWGLRSSWIVVALASLAVLMLPLIRIVIEPRTHMIVSLAREAADGPLPVTLRTRIQDPVLGTGLQTAAAVVFGIVFLMTTKPSLVGSIIAMAIATALGLASGLRLYRPIRTSRT
jgi:hypothetical protein